MTTICHVYYIRENSFCKQKASEHQVLFPMSEGSITLVEFLFSNIFYSAYILMHCIIFLLLHQSLEFFYVFGSIAFKDG